MPAQGVAAAETVARRRWIQHATTIEREPGPLQITPKVSRSLGVAVNHLLCQPAPDTGSTTMNDPGVLQPDAAHAQRTDRWGAGRAAKEVTVRCGSFQIGSGAASADRNGL